MEVNFWKPEWPAKYQIVGVITSFIVIIYNTGSFTFAWLIGLSKYVTFGWVLSAQNLASFYNEPKTFRNHKL